MLTSFARGAKSKLARICLGASVLVGLSGCGFELLPRFAQPGFYRDYKDGEVTGLMKIPKRQEEPIFFNAAKENPDGSYSDIRDIFYPGDEIHVVAEIPYGGKITNFGLALDKNEKIPKDLVNGALGVEIVFKGYLKKEGFAVGVFDASKDLEKYGNHHRIYWLVNDKIIGFKDYVIMDKRPKVYTSK